LDHLAAAERRGGVSGGELGFVRVVVKHLADPIDIGLGQRLRYAFGDAIANRIRVTDTLALDDLDLLIVDRTAVDWLDPDVPLGHVRGFDIPAPITSGNHDFGNNYRGLYSRSRTISR